MSNRNSFFIKHLSGSVFIAFCVSLIVFCIWYPVPLAKSLGVTHVFFMLLVVDVIVGPLLSFIVYKEGKRTLKMDLAVIIILQLAALIYGVFHIYQGRPVVLAFQNYQFEMVRFNDVIEVDHGPKLSLFKPEFIAVDMGKTIAEKNQYFTEEMLTGIPAAYRSERYIPIKESAYQLLKEKRSLGELIEFNNKDDINKTLSLYPAAVGWLPLRVMSGLDMVVLIDIKGTVINVVDLRPWGLS